MLTGQRKRQSQSWGLQVRFWWNSWSHWVHPLARTLGRALLFVGVAAFHQNIPASSQRIPFNMTVIRFHDQNARHTIMSVDICWWSCKRWQYQGGRDSSMIFAWSLLTHKITNIVSRASAFFLSCIIRAKIIINNKCCQCVIILNINSINCCQAPS